MKKLKERSIFLETVGDTPKLRILNFLITFQHFDYSLTDIAKNAQVSYTNVEKILPVFQKKGIVIQTRKVGKAKMFKLNTENPIAIAISQLQLLIIKSAIHKKHPLKPVSNPITTQAPRELQKKH